MFETWRELLPYPPRARSGRTWQDAAQSCSTRRPACTCSARSSGQQFTGRPSEDLDFFAFPEINPKRGPGRGRGADRRLHACPRRPKNEAAAKALLEYLGERDGAEHLPRVRPEQRRRQQERQQERLQRDPEEGGELIAGPKQISQFLDRDTRPDFASTVMIPALQEFIKNPDDIDGLDREHRAAEEDHLRSDGSSRSTRWRRGRPAGCNGGARAGPRRPPLVA